MALEGSHRIAAAYDLGIEPELIILEQDDKLDISGFDWFDDANWDDTIYTAGELYSAQARAYRF